MRRGTEWFINDMVLLFVPAVLAVLDHRELFGLVGLKVLVLFSATMKNADVGVRMLSRFRTPNTETKPSVARTSPFA